MDGRIDGWMDMDGRIDGWMDGWMDRKINGRKERWMDMDGWMDGTSIIYLVYTFIPKCLLGKEFEWYPWETELASPPQGSLSEAGRLKITHSLNFSLQALRDQLHSCCPWSLSFWFPHPPVLATL
jgi:hypothetical protein